MSAGQLTLPLALDHGATFASWLAGPNQLPTGRLQQLVSQPVFGIVYLWGARGSGRTHCLQACCHWQQAAGLSPMYLDLAQHASWSPEILEGLENTTLLCLDRVDALLGHVGWETALFHCYNRCQMAGVPWVVAASQPSGHLRWHLPDLKTRLGSGETYHLQLLSDPEKCEALQKHCAVRGLVLSPEVGLYWLRHGERSMPELMRDLERLDQAAWQTQRALTIPFLKSVLDW